MTKFVVKMQGYGGGGPSGSPFISEDIEQVKAVMESLIASDHAVQLYKEEANGLLTRIPYETYSYVTCEVDISALDI